MPAPQSQTWPGVVELAAMAARFAPAAINADASILNPRDRKALPKIVAAARLMDDIYLDQAWTGNKSLLAKLRRDRSPLGKARLDYFLLNKGPWSSLDDHRAFLPGVPEKRPPGANFYPLDMTAEEFSAWMNHAKAEGFFSLVRRGGRGKLKLVRYSREYAPQLAKAAALLNQAAALTDNRSLQRFLKLRAKAFLTDNYHASDIAWLELDSPIDVTIGPYETYTDEIFGYKAAFEAYVSIRDAEASDKLKFFAAHLQEIEDNLPVEARYRNPKIGALTPIVVVNQILAAGDGARGVMTAAYNLPNDDRVVREKGTKQVMMRNVLQAKFDNVLKPIAGRVLRSQDRSDLSFDWFFTHILAHELAHGIGPHDNVRQSLKELHSAIEEAKADSTGLFLVQHMFDRGLLPKAERALYTTFLASAFRTLRFGIQEAHGRGMALQMSWLLDRGAFRVDSSGRFYVDFEKIAGAVRDLVSEILTIEARGDYAAAKAMLDRHAVLRPEVAKVLKGLSDIPVDIRPVDGAG